jgi:tubulin polyglutamylase TTLL6/13
VQRYLHKPYLIDNLKFDMRIYVLVYGVDPLRVFVFREGLARFATEEYTGPFKNNLDNLFMHLTNYAINKNNENFEHNEDSADDETGSKRSITAVLKHIEDQEKNPNITAAKLWEQIDDIAVKTLISAQP